MEDNAKTKNADGAQPQAGELPAVVPSTPEQIEQLKERAGKAD